MKKQQKLEQEQPGRRLLPEPSGACVTGIYNDRSVHQPSGPANLTRLYTKRVLHKRKTKRCTEKTHGTVARTAKKALHFEFC